MKRYLSRFLISSEGTTAMEYGLIACLVSVAIVLLLSSVSTSIQALFSKVASCFP